mgnify:FL=1
MMARTIRLAAAACLLVFAPAVACAETYRPYQNARFGTEAEIPASFRAERAPDNDDGRKFVSPDGAAEIIVYAGHGPSTVTGTFAEYRNWMAENEDGRITYRAGGSHWFVLSGTDGDRIFYLKALAGCPDRSIAHHVRIVYPASQKAAYDAIVRRVAASLSFTDTRECGGAPASDTPPADDDEPAGEPE